MERARVGTEYRPHKAADDARHRGDGAHRKANFRRPEGDPERVSPVDQDEYPERLPECAGIKRLEEVQTAQNPACAPWHDAPQIAPDHVAQVVSQDRERGNQSQERHHRRHRLERQDPGEERNRHAAEPGATADCVRQDDDEAEKEEFKDAQRFHLSQQVMSTGDECW
jgi:hypothetical protein